MNVPGGPTFATGAQGAPVGVEIGSRASAAGERGEREGGVGTIAVAVAALAVLVSLTFANPWVFSADDSLFYLVIAEHVTTGGGWTFNGLMPTNGVQPLWQLLTVVAVAIADLVGLGSPATMLRVVVAVNWILASVALTQMWRLSGRLGASDPVRLIGVVLLGCCLCGPWGLFASEGHLVAVTLLWLLSLLERWVSNGPSTSTAITAGVAAGMMMLSRLDTVWVAAAAMTCLVVAQPGAAVGTRLRRTALAVVAAAMVVLPYLVWNLVEFRHLNSIAGSIKVDVGSPRFSVDGIGIFGVAIIAAIWIGGYFGVLRAPRWPVRVAVWAVPAVGASVSSAFYFAFSQGSFTQWYWYFIPHAVAFVLTGSLVAVRVEEGDPRLGPRVAGAARLGCAGLAVASTAFCATRYVFGPPDALWTEARSFSADMADVLDDSEAVAAVDMPGVIALLSGRPVVALDGLTGDFDFQDRLRDAGVSCTLDELGVRYLVTVYDRGVVAREEASVELSLSSWLHREPTSTLRGRDPLLVSPAGDYTLWRLERGCDPPS